MSCSKDQLFGTISPPLLHGFPIDKPKKIRKN